MKIKVKVVASGASRQLNDSGVEWIGLIPDDWDIQKVKNAFVRKKEEAHQEEPVVLSLARSGVKVRDISTNEGQLAESYYNYNLVEKGDLLINPMDLYSGANCSISNVEGVISPAYINLRAISGYNPRYYDYYFKTQYWSMAFFAHGKGVSFDNRWTLSFADLNNYLIPAPSCAEQCRIANYLDSECARIDSVIEKTRESIEEYKKLKQSIITEAVTKGIRPNREMKDSGVEWIGLMPADWETINPKALFALRKDKACPGERQLTSSQQYGIVYQDEYMELTGSKVVTVEKDFDILKHVENGDFVISMRSFQGGIEYSTKTGSISSAYVMLVPNLKKVFPRYYRWLFKSAVYIDALQTTTNMVRDGQAMRYSHFAKIRLMVLPKKEQEEIADYLDDYCAKLDRLIDKKEEYITQVEAYKKSLIYEYVTGKKEVPVC